MTMTVAELIAEPQLGLTLIAGAAGLENPITWAHTSDLPRLWEWVTGGELMMTNGMSIPADAPGQVALIEALVVAGASALAIGEKMHAPQLQPEFLAASDELAFPVLSIPFPLPFIAIARSVAESSMLEESQRLRQTARMYDLMRQTGTSGDEWRELLRGIGGNLDAAVFVVNRRCLHPWHADDPTLPADVSAALAPLLSAPVDASKKFLWHRLADARDILMMDVPTHADAVLVVLPRSVLHPDAVVLLHAATVVGLVLSRITLARESERRLGAEILAQVLDGRVGAAEFERRIGDFGVPADEFIVASLAGADDRQLTDVHLSLWRHGAASLGVRRLSRLHLLLPAVGTEEVLRHVVDPGVRIGLSRPSDVNGLQRALQESLWALATAESVAEPLLIYAEGPSWLGLTSFEEGAALVERLLGPVIAYEAGHQPDLLITLKTFLEAQRSVQKTAAALFVHRQTIVYRMHKIGELTGLDMAETSTIAQLWFALQIHEAMDAQNLAATVTRPLHRPRDP
ncbi:PucR family transcriptional regulator [Microbacterium capsulatum]|uniref:PucR family transcriptional regulator n=1 Tax=Microbacterium capsulatum TaxID=3041921 RepID=A0ABU0XF01_9MICO|nr:PucR family transcriptional regulator [Microbacterium sp. ASV81]MDQ4213689.1 PucR family transcriptional regulator [Microbacterium sp. ASV81]